MKKKTQFSLIEGDFLSEEAKEILTNVFLAKIHFHEMKNFSSMERFGKPDKMAKKRIAELKRSMKTINAKISEAELKNKKLIISSVVNISLEDHK